MPTRHGLTVDLIDHMGDDLRVANVARTSFDKWKKELDQKDVKLIDYLALNEHTSPFRHTAITIRVKAPIWLARQLGKHQIGMSWNETSRRYVANPPEFFTPTEWRKRPEASIKQGSGAPLTGDELEAVELLHRLNEQCARVTYEKMLALGVAPELARGELPQNMLTTWIWTGSLTAFFHCWRLRADSHAQKEAQHFAELLDELIPPLFPHSWRALKDG